jgi:phage tail sheath protein FI
MAVLKLSTPGVYVQEISTFPPSVAEVETAIPAFIGYTEKADHLVAGDLKNLPTKIASLSEYTLYYGNPAAEAHDSIAISVIDNGSGSFVVNITPDLTKQSKHNMAYAIQQYFDNGGGTCYIVSVGDYLAAMAVKDLIDGLSYVENIDEVTILSIPEAQGLTQTDYNSVVQKLIDQASRLKDRFALIDPYTVTLQDIHNPSGQIDSDVNIIRNVTIPDLETSRYAAAYYPNLITSYSRNFIDSATNKIQDLTIQTYTYTGSDATKDLKLTGKNLSDIPGKTGSTLYGKIISVLGQYTAVLPPSPAIAGLYARVDQNKGVWKAPANEGLQSVIGPNVAISDAQQMNLNIDPNFGKSINAIRNFPGYGTVVWGARTLNGNDNEWRYINVRRFFTMVEESVKKSSHWAVFEPNTITTWVKIQAMVENYLFLKWRDGALAGVKPEQAFYVKVGLGSTMNAQDILEGRMNVEIGMAVARPAEFIVLKFSQLLQQS